jgi:ATP-dependent helicase/nuclease subunit A
MSKQRGKDIHLIDKSVRESISTELDKTMMVEAGAGSGKTTSLVSRMVALIGEGKTTIEKISAVTFTRKAAAELRERFQIELEKSFQGSVNKRKKGSVGHSPTLSRLSLGQSIPSAQDS